MAIQNPKHLISQPWLLQVGYWGGLCVITFFSLTVWYGQVDWTHASHTAIQALAGLILSYPLHIVFSLIWNSPQVWRVVISFISVAIVALAWNIFRMVVYRMLTGEDKIMDDFGGWYFGAIFVFLCWTALYHGIRYQQLLLDENSRILEAEDAVSQEKLRRIQAESKAKDAKLEMLRYQLNPHFLFNTLNAINSLVGIGDSKRAQKMIVQLSQFMRYSLDNNPKMKIPLEREVDALMLYLEIEKTRFGDRLTIDFELDSNSSLALVPSLLLQPLIENSMKYAIAKTESGGVIQLRAHRDSDSLVLKLSDSGTAGELDSDKISTSPPGRGIGLRNTIDRLKAFYGEDYSFDLSTSRAGGLRTTITIPFEVEHP